MIKSDYHTECGLLCDEKSDLLLKSHSIHYRSGETIFKQLTPANQLLWIESGIVKICKESENNKVIIVRMCTDNDYLQLTDLFKEDNNLHDSSAIAITDVTVRYVDATCLYDLIHKDTSIGLWLLKMVSNENQILKNQLFSRSIKNLPGRVADMILYFFDLNNQSEEFEIPLNRTELAQFISTTKESLIRTLSEFKNDKIIDLDDKKVKINSLKIIQTLSYYG